MDYKAIEAALQAMQPRQKLYELIKAELTKRGHWKAKPRGNSFKPGTDERRGKLA